MVSNNLAFLLFLPAICANIQVNIIAQENSKPYADGDQRDPISDAERKIFNLTEENLKESIRKYFGEKPDDVFLRSPTPWNDLYSTYSWPQVKTVHKVEDTRFEFNTTTIMIKDILYNNTGAVTKNYTVKVNRNLIGSLKLQRNINNNFRNFRIVYKIFLDPNNSSNLFIHNAPCCRNYETKQNVTIFSTSDINLTVHPSQTTSTLINVYKHTVKVDLKYVTTLLGTATANYNKKHKGHHFWSFGITSLLDSGHLKKAEIGDETLEFVYYSNPWYVIEEKINGSRSTRTESLNITTFKYHD